MSALEDGSFEVVEHTADWAIRVCGPSYQAVLEQAAHGMNSLLVPFPEEVPLAQARELEITAFDRESMLVEWLSELAYLAEMENLLFRRFNWHVASPTICRVGIEGGPAGQLQKHIKAVTYHDLAVVERNGLWEATIVFDV